MAELTTEERLKLMTENRDYWRERYKEALAHYAARVAESEAAARQALDIAQKVKDKLAAEVTGPII